MTNVLRVDGDVAGVDAWVEKTLPAYHPDLYLQFDVYWPTASMNAWTVDGGLPFFLGLREEPAGGMSDAVQIKFDPYPTVKWESAGSVVTASHVANDAWHTVQVRMRDVLGTDVNSLDIGVDGDPPTVDADDVGPSDQVSDSGVTAPLGDAAARSGLATSFVASGGPVRLITTNVNVGGGAPTDNVVVSICSDAAGVPGAALGSISILGSALASHRYGFFGVGFDFSAAGVTLVAGTTYWITVTRSGAVSAVNYYSVAESTTSTTGAAFNGAVWASSTDAIGMRMWYSKPLILRLGNYLVDGTAAATYFRNILVGTTAGASDVWSEDFSTGTPALGHFDTTSGDVTVIADPTGAPPPATPHGILLDFTGLNGALGAVPDADWTDLLSVNGISVTRVEVDRGRPSETDKFVPGTGTIEGIDTVGALDPTNPTSPFYNVALASTKLDPCIQARIELPNPVDSTWHPIFTGNVANIIYRIAPTGEFAYFTIELVDGLDILSNAEVIPGGAGAAAPPQSAGNCYYAGQQVDDRIRAALADAALSAGVLEWPAARMTIFSGNVAMPGKSYSAKTTILTVIDDGCDAEFPGVSIRFIDRFGVFIFHGRYARFNPATFGIPTWKIGDMAAFNADPTYCAISNDFSFDRSKDNLINAILVTPTGIKTADIAGQFVHDATSIGKYGARSISFELLEVAHGDEASPLDAKDEVKQYGTYYVDNRAKPQNRPETISFTNQDPAGAHGPVTYALLCAIELGDVAQLKTTHPGGGGFADVKHYVEHLHYDLTPGPEWEVHLDVEVSPAGHFAVNPFAA